MKISGKEATRLRRECTNTVAFNDPDRNVVKDAKTILALLDDRDRLVDDNKKLRGWLRVWKKRLAVVRRYFSSDEEPFKYRLGDEVEAALRGEAPPRGKR